MKAVIAIVSQPYRFRESQWIHPIFSDLVLLRAIHPLLEEFKGQRGLIVHIRGSVSRCVDRGC